MDLSILIGRTIFFYFFVLLIFRLMGKREIGELSVMDLIVFFMMSEVATIAIEKRDLSLIQGVIPIITLGILQYTIAYLSLKNRKVRKLLDGEASIIIENGKIKDHVMRRMRYTIDDLLLQLREKNIMDASEVQFAVLEANGKLSVMKKDENKQKKVFIYPLIMDGEVVPSILKKIDKDEKWLNKALAEQGYNSVQEVFYCSYVNGRLFIDPYE